MNNISSSSLVKSVSRRARRAISAVSAFLLIISVSSTLIPGISFVQTASADTVAQTLPFSQNWSNTGLITADNNWSAVPGIIAYRGDDIITTIGTDPQTVLTDGSGTPVSVIANQTAPDTLNSGGVAEFEIANPTIALNGSGTADAPHVVISINTTNQSGVTLSYNLRDLDGSIDNAASPVALQYRVGSTGGYTNIPAGFVSDATGGPNQATLVTPVSITLPAACNNQPFVQVRIISTNSVGNDEWIGVDDIQIGTGGAVTLSGTGSASPTLVDAGATTKLTVAVSPATNPNSTGIAVTGNLSSIGGSTTQQFFDDGTNGDATAGDNIFSYLASVPANTTSGAKNISVSIADAQNRTATTAITLTVRAAASPAEHLVFGNPSNAVTDVNQPLNYLLLKNQYVMSYNRDLGRPNWVSWHLDSTWLGNAARQDDFRPDPSLPTGFYQVLGTDYSGSGFDRGHHTPSADRTVTVPDNSATFLMTNMMPQAPDNNQGPWEELESYCRTLVNQGNELYIVMGGAGQGGIGSNGAATTIAGGKVSVPAQTWKVIIVLPAGDNDLSRVTAATQTIAVIMPNVQGIRNVPFEQYRTSIDRVESLTGYNFFSNLPDNIENAIEAVSPNAPPPPAFFDFDGDARADLSVTRTDQNNELVWYAQNSRTGFSGTRFGIATDKIIPGDYDGDGKKDLAVVRANADNSTTVYILQTRDGFKALNFGIVGDVFAPADYDGDGRTDLGIYRVTNGQGIFAYTASATQGSGTFTVVPFGTTNDKPVPADYDGDGRADLAVVRFENGASNWYIRSSRTNSVTATNFGLSTDKLVQADYDGDGKTDIAVVRTNGDQLFWYILQTSGGFTGSQFGASGDALVPADYDGDGKTDLAVTRTNGNQLVWYIQQTTNGFTGTQFGASSDKPVETAYIP